MPEIKHSLGGQHHLAERLVRHRQEESRELTEVGNTGGEIVSVSGTA